MAKNQFRTPPYTQGPWKVFDKNYPLGTISVNKDTSIRICTITEGMLPESILPEKERLANATIIAAAPEMYEALKKLIYHIGTNDNNPPSEFKKYCELLGRINEELHALPDRKNSTQ